MTERNIGRTAGFVVFGEIMDRDSDPTQTGKCKVKWNIGGVNQSQMGTEDLPYSSVMYPSSNPSLNNVGQAHTGLMKGSKVIGIPISGDGQEIVIIGSMLSAGQGGTDGTQNYKSDLPIPGQSQENGGVSQGSYGDRNGIVTQDSIVKYGQDEGGDNGAAKYHDIDEPIGTFQKAIV